MTPLEDASHHACTKKLKCLMGTHATAGHEPAATQSEGFFAYTVLFIRGSLLVHDVMTTEMGLVVVDELLELEMY